MNWEIEGLKRIDGILGGIACSVSKLVVKPRAALRTPPKILVIRPGGIGDAVLLYPALSELRKAFPDSTIHVLAEKRNAGILDGCPYIDGVLLYDSRPLKTLSRVFGEGYDIVIDTEQWHRMTAALSYLTKACVRAGFATNERAALFTHPVTHSKNDYEAESFLNLVSAVTGKSYVFDRDEPFIPIDRNRYSSVIAAVEEFGKHRRAVVGVFAGATVRERRWGTERFAELSKGLQAERVGIALLGGKTDLTDAALVKEALDADNVLDFTGKTSLMETAAVISALDLFISSDTGLMHIAYGVGTLTVSLFGAGIEKKWAPSGKDHVVINKRLPCSPCTEYGYTPPCPYDVKCLSEITVAEVKEAALKLLESSSRRVVI